MILPRCKCLLILFLQSPSPVISEPKKYSLSLFSLFPHLFAMKWWDWSRLVKAMVFPVDMNGCENWTINKAEHWRIDAFELWCWRRLLRIPWTARRSNQSILNEISPEYSLEGLMLKLKLQYFGHLMWRAGSLERTLMLGKIEGRRKGMTEDETVGWHHWFNGHEFEQAPGVGDGQGSLVCYSPWDHKESDMTEQLNWTEPSTNFRMASCHCISLS